MGWITILKYTLISRVRSNRFLGSYIISLFLHALMYFSLSVLYVILSGKLEIHFLLGAIALMDICIKYYSPGQFTEYTHTLLKLTLARDRIITFVIISIVFYYFNLAIIPALAIGMPINVLLTIWSIFVLNHMFVFLIKLVPIFSIRAFVLFALLVLGIGMMIILRFEAIVSVFSLMVISVVFSKAVKDSLYVK